MYGLWSPIRQPRNKGRQTDWLVFPKSFLLPAFLLFTALFTSFPLDKHKMLHAYTCVCM